MIAFSKRSILSSFSQNSYSPKQMLAKLIGFDTTSRESNLPLIRFVQDYLHSHGVTTHLVSNDSGDKTNLFATIGPADVAGGVVLSGHTDVVPVDGQDWHTNPFELTEKAGKLYGRGTVDMKGFLAIILALVPDMQKAKMKRPIHLALSYDEEVGCLGAPRMIEKIATTLPPVSAVIVGEPSEMKVVTAHKGISTFTTEVTGFEVHSSQVHRGVSAVMMAANLVNWLLERSYDKQRGAKELIETGELPDNLSYFDPPFTSIHVGTIRGGTATNIMAKHCAFSWDVRAIPGENARDLQTELTQYCEETVIPIMHERHKGCTVTTRAHSDVPALRHKTDCPAATLARQLTGDNGRHAVSYAAEAGQFQRAGFSAVICGPGSINQAHQPNEYISEEQFEAGISFIKKLIQHLTQ